MRFWLSDEWNDISVWDKAYQAVNEHGVKCWYIDIESLEDLLEMCKQNGGTISIETWMDNSPGISTIGDR